jgi:hypothetical protein
LAARSSLYGLGFTFAHRLPYDYDYYDSDDDEDARDDDGASDDGNDHESNEEDGSANTNTVGRKARRRSSGSNVRRSEKALKSAIAKREFSMVVYGNVHRGRPLWEDVLAAGYGAAGHLVLLDGEDEQGQWSPVHTELRRTGAHLYVREMPPGCPA